MNQHHPKDWRPTASWRVLRLRAELLQAVRNIFHEDGYLEVETPLLSQETVVDADAQHGSVQRGPQSPPQDAQQTTSYHHVAQGDESASPDCPCCDHCVTMCVMSGCDLAAITAESRGPSRDVDRSSMRPTDLFRVGPAPHPLFRPPIPID